MAKNNWSNLMNKQEIMDQLRAHELEFFRSIIAKWDNDSEKIRIMEAIESFLWNVEEAMNGEPVTYSDLIGPTEERLDDDSDT